MTLNNTDCAGLEEEEVTDHNCDYVLLVYNVGESEADEERGTGMNLYDIHATE